MSYYPKAQRWLLPENDTQERFRATQFIIHSVAAPWTVKRIYEYWREPNVTVESHFGVDYTGLVAQYMDTFRVAHANAKANRNAISVETSSKVDSSDPWNAAQIGALADLMVWAHRTHGIPLRKCQTWQHSGFGFHKMFAEWSLGGTSCPGTKRAKQFDDLLELAQDRARAPKPKPPAVYRPPAFPAGLKPNTSKPSARGLQTALKAAGYLSRKITLADNYGTATQEAVRKFHRANPKFGKAADSAIGPKGWEHVHLEAYRGVK